MVELLFQCPACPKTLKVKDLWEKPKEVAAFLEQDLTEEITFVI